MPSQAVARSGEQVRGSVPSSTKVEVDWDEFEDERDILSKLPLDQLLKEVRVPPPKIDPAPLHLLDASRRCMSPRHLTRSSVLVHVYNLNETFMQANRVLAVAGSGAFHAGVEIFDWEWSYGIFGVRKTIPRNQTRHIYKCSVFLGDSEVGQAEFVELLRECFQDFMGEHYELVGHNCCTFARALVRKLQVRAMPSWVDRLARGLNFGAKAARVATRPMKQAAALGGRMLRMGRGAGSESDDDEDLTDLPSPVLQDGIPGQIATAMPQPCAQQQQQPGFAIAKPQLATGPPHVPANGGVRDNTAGPFPASAPHGPTLPLQQKHPEVHGYVQPRQPAPQVQQVMVPQAVQLPASGAPAPVYAMPSGPYIYIAPGQMYPGNAHTAAPQPGFR